MPPKKKKEPQIDRRVVKGGHIEGAGQVVSQPITETLRENYICSGCGEAARYDPIPKLKIMFPLIMARAKRRPF